MTYERLNLKSLYTSCCNILFSQIGDYAECESITRLLLNHFFNASYTDIILNNFVEIDDKIKAEIDIAIKRLLKNEPIQYVLGYEFFLERKFIVDKNVLIPRPETEDFVQRVIKDNREQINLSLLDIGTGSGCIAISLKKELKNITVHALDISQEAMSVAMQNAKNLDAEVFFMKEDVLRMNVLSQKYNIIVSNPPYVLESEKKIMHANVLDYEPHNALFVSDNSGLIFYEKITGLAKKNLMPNGKLYFEINEALGQNVRQLLIDYGFKNVSIINDRHEKNRFVVGNL